jgi:hypothetical protein
MPPSVIQAWQEPPSPAGLAGTASPLVIAEPGGISHLEPLIDRLVHGQDIAIPLGLDRPVPVPAAVAAAGRIWPDLYPFRARRRLAGLRLSATDCAWSAGEGTLVQGPIAALLLALTGRPVSGGLLAGGEAVAGGIAVTLPVDIWLAGSPPSPFGILNALLLAVGQLADGPRRKR